MVWKKLFEKFQEGCLVDDHHAQKNRCCLMNNKMAVKFLAIFDF